MTYLSSNALGDNVILEQSRDFNAVWYNLIQRLGCLPVDTDGVTIDSIEAAKANIAKSPNNLTCLTGQSENYRTNKRWFMLRMSK